ncbi:MAG: hypothetical protein ACK5Q5_22560 [Planctomycetaceae bacterium]
MPKQSGLATAWIAGLYGLVALAAVAAWRTHQGTPIPSSTAALGAESDSRGARGREYQVVQTDAVPGGHESGESIDEIVARAAQTLKDQGLDGEHLLFESAPSADPAVRERQQKIQLGVGASLGGIRPFPDDNPWNQRVDTAPVDPLSETILRSIGFERGLHPDFGRGEWDGAKIGIPYIVVSGAQPKVDVDLFDFPDQSEPGPYPIPAGAPIEGFPNEENDRHVVVLDRDQWKLYELFYASEGPLGWKASCGAAWDLNSNNGRPAGWTSADAAGLPIFPGLVRYDEVESGEIRHALRFTVAKTRRAFVPPASHWASRESSPILPPMGMRVRLRKDFDISKFPRHTQVILQCLKDYGMILADNGSNWFISGSPDERWDNEALHTIKQVTGANLEIIRMDGLVAE